MPSYFPARLLMHFSQRTTLRGNPWTHTLERDVTETERLLVYFISYKVMLNWRNFPIFRNWKQVVRKESVGQSIHLFSITAYPALRVAEGLGPFLVLVKCTYVHTGCAASQVRHNSGNCRSSIVASMQHRTDPAAQEVWSRDKIRHPVCFQNKNRDGLSYFTAALTTTDVHVAFGKETSDKKHIKLMTIYILN